MASLPTQKALPSSQRRYPHPLLIPTLSRSLFSVFLNAIPFVPVPAIKAIAAFVSSCLSAGEANKSVSNFSVKGYHD